MQLKRFVLSLFTAVCILAPLTSMAQGGLQQRLPVDPEVRMGTLPNGLTYIIRHNETPKNRANYYIAQKVGSILEEDSQRGLAHFLEHMAFNGTKNFPGKNLISFLERIGCQFGADLNAYTAFDETVYTVMDAPTDRGNEVIDSCLLIMHDWSHNITLDPKEIDDERGVIHEEWRSRDNANLRMLSSMLPKMLPGNKYAERMPIGTMEVVDNFKHSEIVAFYQKWYRPDLQGIIVVGDIDVDYVEAKLKEIFADVPTPVNPAERYQVPVEDNKEPIVAIATDKEATSTNIQIIYKQNVLPLADRGTFKGVIFNYVNSISSQIINERFRDITRKPNAPFMGAGTYYGNLLGITQTKDARTFAAMAADGNLKVALKALVQEIERLNKYGILESEYDRAKKNHLKQYEDLFNSRSNRKNTSYCEEYSDYFLHGGYIPGIEMEKQLMELLSQQISADMISKMIKENITDGENLIITVMAPQKEGLSYPTEAELLAYYKECVALPVEAKQEEVIDTNLIDKALPAGKLVKTKKNQKFGTTELTLGNGVTVYLKKTDFKKDQILLSAAKHGGTRLYNNTKDINNAQVIDEVAGLGGLGKFEKTALDKALTGRSVKVSPVFGEYTTGISGNATVADFETMLQLIYLTMTDLRQDNDAFEAFKQKSVESLRMKERQPFAVVGDSINFLLWNNHPWHKDFKAEDMERVDYKRTLQMARELLANANGMKFFIVGNFDEAEATKLITKYLGALNKGKLIKPMDRTKKERVRQGAKTIEISKDMNTPTAIVVDYLTGPTTYDQKAVLTAQILNGVLDQTLIASIREREGGVYSPSASSDIEEYPSATSVITTQFFCAPERAAQLNQVVFQEFDLIVKNGVSQEYFDKTIVNMKKRHAENVRENAYWLGNLKEYFFKGYNWVDNYDTVLDSIKPVDVQNHLKAILESGNNLQLFFRSTETEADKGAAK